MNVTDLDRARRWRTTSATWFRKTAHLLHGLAQADESEAARWLLGYEAVQVLESVLDDALLLVPLVVTQEMEEVGRRAADLARQIRRARVAGLLENTEGRTPEEVETFRQAAADLRGRGL